MADNVAYPFLHFPSLLILLKPLLAKARYTLEKGVPSLCHRADTEKQTSIHTHIQTYGQFRVASCRHLACLGTVGGSRSALRESPQAQRQYANSTRED